MSINVVCISGNLTRDAEVRRTQSGMAITSFCVAVNERRKNKNTGEWENYANYIDCTMFGAYGESVSESLRKGVKVACAGSLRWTQWERDGQKRSKIEVIVNELELPPREKPAVNYAPPKFEEVTETGVYHSDIPF